MREPVHPKSEDFELERVLYALSDPVRLCLIRRLAGAPGELTCSDLGSDRPKSSMSHHFKVLRESGLLHTRVEGSVHYNALRREELDQRFPGLLDSVLAVPPSR